MEELDQFTARLHCKTIKRKEFLLVPGQTCDYICFIEQGSFRFYSVTEHGQLTMHFFTEQQWVADLESLLAQQPSNNYIEAFDDAMIDCITMQDIHELMDRHPAFRMLNALLSGLTIPQARVASLATKNPDERYRELLLNHPDWINRFPQMHIASYLGITPETLSRVRGRIS